MSMNSNPAAALKNARAAAELISKSPQYERFVEGVCAKFRWSVQIDPAVLKRDYLQIVDHHLRHLIPLLGTYMNPNIGRVLDFGCGSGGSAIALAMVYPSVYCYGTDVDAEQISVARARAKLYNVADRCEFHCVRESEPLPFSDGFFDFSLCSSVLEYVTDVNAREFCVKEMVRLVAPQGLLFFSVPNRLYPFEIHTRKWGWNYFPKKLRARTVDSTFWEVRNLARPTVLKLYRTPLVRLFRPWSNFCLQREHA
jgi:SAM-dependent methyltransferase